MSYYASGSGWIEFKKDCPNEIKESFEKLSEKWADDCSNWGESIYDLTISNGIYHDDDIWDTLKFIEPYTKEGDIRFNGEARDTLWQIWFDKRNNIWREDLATIIWASETANIN